VAGGSLDVLFVTSQLAEAPAQNAGREAARMMASSISHALDAIGGGVPPAPVIVSGEPLEQVMTTRDATDYLWYSTPLTLPNPVPPTPAALELTNMSDYVYLYLDGAYTGLSSRGDGHTPVTLPLNTSGLSAGTHTLQFLVLTQGLIHYLAFQERWARGLLGDVLFNGVSIVTGPAASQNWTHTVGLLGEALNWAAPAFPAPWVNGQDPPEGTQLVWYRLTIGSPDPLPADSVWAIDLASMGKGQAFLNGNALGRYWSILATQMPCDPCDYRGSYGPSNCRTGCGEPSQRYYHAPREWLSAAGQANVVVLLEEDQDSVTDVELVALVRMNP
jgi:hypothetical protein